MVFNCGKQRTMQYSLTWYIDSHSVLGEKNFISLKSQYRLQHDIFIVIFGINTTSDISKLLYVISRASRRVKFETILKHHKWYLCQISHTNHAIICLYYYPQRFCNLHMQVFQLKLKYHCFKPIKLQKVSHVGV